MVNIMKKYCLALTFSMLSLVSLTATSNTLTAPSNNIIRFNAPIAEGLPPDVWKPAAPKISDWVVEQSSGCVDSPIQSNLAENTTVQYQSCDAVTSTRTTQPREYNARLGQYRDAGESTVEKKTSSTLNQPRYMTCLYSTSSPVSYWRENGAGAVNVIFNNKNILGAAKNQKQITVDGLTYLRGKMKSGQGGSGSSSYTLDVICLLKPSNS